MLSTLLQTEIFFRKKFKTQRIFTHEGEIPYSTVPFSDGAETFHEFHVFHWN